MAGTFASIETKSLSQLLQMKHKLNVPELCWLCLVLERAGLIEGTKASKSRCQLWLSSKEVNQNYNYISYIEDNIFKLLYYCNVQE